MSISKTARVVTASIMLSFAAFAATSASAKDDEGSAAKGAATGAAVGAVTGAGAAGLERSRTEPKLAKVRTCPDIINMP